MNNFNINNDDKLNKRNMENKYKKFNTTINEFSSSPTSKFQYYIMLVLFGYFGIKIFMGSFGKYPHKFYEKKMIINTNEICKLQIEEENIQKKIVMDYFIPGIVNNEIYDIVITLILTSVIFLFTDIGKRKGFGEFGEFDFIFIIGYIIGLNSLFYKSFFEEDNNITPVNYFYLIIFILIMSFMVVLSAWGAISSNGLSIQGGLGGYILYIIILVILIIGSIITRKKIKQNNTLIYTTNDPAKCNSVDYGGYQTSGEYIKMSMTFMACILLLLFVYDPPITGLKYIYYLINGVILGIFISGMSFYGFEYFLTKKPDLYCNGEEDCKNKNIQINKKINNKNSDEVDVIKWLLGSISIIVLFIIIYLFYNK
jgi:uncharacterized membrane protein